MKLLTVIVNYRTADLALEALRGLTREMASIADARAVVVDNDSGDGSFEKLTAAVEAEGWEERVRVVAAPRNGGFAYGNNLAVREALASDDPPEYVYLLNPDAVPDPGAVGTLVRFLDAHPDAGLAGSAVRSPRGEPLVTTFRFPSLLSELEDAVRLGVVSRVLEPWRVPQPLPREVAEVDWLEGASLMIRAAVFEQVGLMDEAFFLYYEETDFCRRARLAGWRCCFVPESTVVHVGSAATGVKESVRRRPSYVFASRRHYFAKNHGRAYLLAANLVWLAGFVSWRARRRLQRKPDPDPPHLLGDFVRHNFLST